MPEATRIGLLDSGVGPRFRVLARARFEATAEGTVVESAPVPGRGHGSALAAIFTAFAPDAELLDAQVFTFNGRSSPAAVAHGLLWLVRNGARIVNMSFGLHEDRDALRSACEIAREANVLLFGATPAKGSRVFPASYPGVIRVSADGRCAHRDISLLDSINADFGACPFPANQYTYGRVASGTSYAVAHVAAIAANWIASRHAATASDVRAYLGSIARYVTGAQAVRQTLSAGDK